MNWYFLIPFAIVVIILIVFLVMRNQKDETKFEDQLKNDYHKTKDEEGDIEIDELTK